MCGGAGLLGPGQMHAQNPYLRGKEGVHTCIAFKASREVVEMGCLCSGSGSKVVESHEMPGEDDGGTAGDEQKLS
jgi:hypothetical protein